MTLMCLKAAERRIVRDLDRAGLKAESRGADYLHRTFVRNGGRHGKPRAWSQRQRIIARSPIGSEGSNHRADRDHDDKRDYGAKDSDHDYVAIALAVRRAADGEQRNHRTVMRQTVEGARTDHRHAMQQGWIEPYRNRALQVGCAKRVQCDRESASTIAAGINRRGMFAVRNSSCAMGARTKKATNRLTPP